MHHPTRVVFAGTPEFAAISLQRLIDKQDDLNIKIVAVYTQPDRKSGRGQKLTASPVKQTAQQYDIPVEQPLTFKKSSDIESVSRETLDDYQPDVMIVAAYGLILPIGVLNIPKMGCLNIHASILPRWRGAAPIHRALLAGDEVTGITIMQMDKGLDTGDMLYKVETAISDSETTASLHDRLAILGADAIEKVLVNLTTYQANAEQQNNDLACYANKLSKSEGQINWQHSAEDIARQIRGMTPYPSTFSFIDGKRLKIIEAKATAISGSDVSSDTSTGWQIGQVVGIDKSAITVLCGEGFLQICKLQFAGSKAVNAEQVLQGSQLNIGDSFDQVADETA